MPGGDTPVVYTARTRDWVFAIVNGVQAGSVFENRQDSYRYFWVLGWGTVNLQSVNRVFAKYLLH